MAGQTVIAAYSEGQAARLTGISVGQLRYWDRTEFFRPEFACEERRAAFSRIYSYLDLISLKVIARLRDETSLQQLR
jgi:DNA-binding transcriptional MerR regulator